MKYFILLTFILALFPAKQQKVQLKKDKVYIPFKVSSHDYSKQSYALYKAMSTGDKSELKMEIVQIFKKYGFIHLLTPSGIHLSSVVFLFKFSKLFEFICLALCFFFISKYQSYFSLERVMIFRLIQNLISVSPIRNFTSEIYFVITLLISLAFGHYTKSHMSFIYSALFWGTIMIFKDNKIKLLLYLNISLFFISSLNGQEASPLSIFINPLITGVISSFFPFLFINQFTSHLINSDWLINYFFKLFISLIKFINELDPFPLIYIGTTTLVIFTICLYFKKNKLAIFLLCFNMTGIQKPNLKAKSPLIVNLGDKTEVVYLRKNWIHFIDQKCKIENMRIFCKKKPSRFGGPVF